MAQLWQNWQVWLWPAIILVGSIFLAFVVHFALFALAKRVVKPTDEAIGNSLLRRAEKATRWIFPLLAIILALPALPVNSPSRYASYLLNSILGGGMSSRLFQSIREDRGLAYSIYSELNPFRDTGSLAVYAGCAYSNAREVLALTLAEFSRLKREPVTAEELDRAKNQLKGNMVLGLESSGSRMSSLARQQLYFSRFFTVDEISDEVSAVTAEEIQQIAKESFQVERIAAAVDLPMPPRPKSITSSPRGKNPGTHQRLGVRSAASSASTPSTHPAGARSPTLS